MAGDEMITLAFTGHRPHKLGGYSPLLDVRLREFAKLCIYGYNVKGQPVTRVISGMAQGWDMAAAEAAIALGIPVFAAIPFAGQESMWPDEARNRYHSILAQCAHVATICGGTYSPHKMHMRNAWMVDSANALCALWDGSKGGTDNCVKYAKRRGVPVENVWPWWDNAL